MSKYKVSDEEFIRAAKTSKSIAELIRIIGYSVNGSSYSYANKKIKELSIDISHFTGQGWNKGGKNLVSRDKTPDEKVFVEHSKFKSNKLRKRLIDGGYKEWKCEKCGRVEWNGEKIPLQVHHINGVNDDNRIENLQILCPNCHAQTDNYAGKNINHGKRYRNRNHLLNEKRVCKFCGTEFYPKNKGQVYCSQKCSHDVLSKKPSKDVLKKLLETESNVSISAMFDVSDTTVRKWRKQYGI